MKLKAFICAVFAAAAMQITAYADTYDTINVSGVPSVGETFVVTVKVVSDSGIGTVGTGLEYDDSVIEFVGGDAIGGGGILTVQGFPDGDPGSVECSLTFRAVAEGSCTLSLTNGYVFSTEGIVLSETSASAVVTVEGVSDDQTEENDPQTDASDADASESVGTEEDVSSAAETAPPTDSEPAETSKPDTDTQQPVVEGYLIDLSCSAGILSPAFSYDVFDYTVYAESTATKAEITAEAAAFSDMVTVDGGSKLEYGSNVKTVTVTAEGGTVRVYTVNIIRPEPDESDKDNSSKAASAGYDKYKEKLNPILAIVLITLVVSLFIIIYWISGLGKKKKE